MEYKDFIKAGNKAIYKPWHSMYFCWDSDEDAQLVTIGQYRPYYTNGNPDPTPDEYDEICRVEVEEATQGGDKQLELGTLFPFVDDVETLLCNGEVRKSIGHDEDCEYYVIETDGDLKVVDSDCIEERRCMEDLTRAELMALRKQVRLGSLHFSDYHNSLGIPINEASDIMDEYGESINWDFSQDSPAHFADFVLGKI